MEEQFFTFDGWDQQDTMVFTFYKVKLTATLGKYPPGTEFGCANIAYDKGELELYKTGEEKEPTAKFKLTLSASEV